MSDLLSLLRQISLLEGLDADHLQQLAAVSRLSEFQPGAVIFREGAEAKDVFLIVSGSVALEICAPGVGCRRILTLESGDLLGWSPVLGQDRLTATARAVTGTQTIQIQASQVLALCEHDARFGYEFMRRAALALARRLNATRLQLVNIYGESMPQAGPGDTP